MKGMRTEQDGYDAARAEVERLLQENPRPSEAEIRMGFADRKPVDVLLALLTAVGPMSVDLYLPSLPELGRVFDDAGGAGKPASLPR